MLITIRELQPSDASKLVKLQKKIDTQTSYLLYEPGERKTTVAEQTKIIKRRLVEKAGTVLAALDGDKFVGYILVLGNAPKRTHHMADLVVGVLEDYRGKGVGRKLMEEAISWAKVNGLHRLELTVNSRNENAKHLYENLGFIVEGVNRDRVLIDGKFEDNLMMSKLI